MTERKSLRAISFVISVPLEGGLSNETDRDAYGKFSIKTPKEDQSERGSRFL